MNKAMQSDALLSIRTGKFEAVRSGGKDRPPHTVFFDRDATWFSSLPASGPPEAGGGLLRFRLLDDSAGEGVDPDGSAAILIVGQFHFVNGMITFFFQMTFRCP